MKTLVIFDSAHGNTEQIAKSIAEGIGGGTTALRVAVADMSALGNIALLVIGSPTYGGRPTEAIQNFIDRIPGDLAKKLQVAAFDTRLTMKLAKVFGYAAGKMADGLSARGATLKSPPEGFFVKGRNGPLAQGELERAAAWAKTSLRS
jgi:flavodoxin